MRLIFVGSGELGLPALRKIAPQILLVVTAPDRPAGRGLKIISTPVKALARQLKMPVIETPDINSAETTAILTTHQPDAIVVAAFGQILKKQVLQIPKYYVLNIHPSLLPKYRGAAPVERAILNQEKETGVSIIKVNERMDAGPVIMQRMVEILHNEDTSSLSRRLAELSAEVLPGTLEKIEKGTAVFTEQDETSATYAPKITREEGRIEWGKDAVEIAARVRAFVRWPHAYAYLPTSPLPAHPASVDKGELLILWKARSIEKPLSAPPGQPGTIIEAGENGIVVACGQGVLLVEELQIAGKKKMSAAEFLRGHKVAAGTVLI